MYRFILCTVFVTILSCTNKEKSMNQTATQVKSEMETKAVSTAAPIAKIIESKLEKHGDTRIDNYYWMKLSDEQKNAKEADQQTKDVLDYLNAENSYRETIMSHTKDFQDSLYKEIVGRIKQTDMSVPFKYNGYYYITRFEEGQDYAIKSRKKGSLDATEEILLNENERAKDKKYYSASGYDVSPDNKILAIGEDVVSRRQYTLRFKDLITGQFLKDEIKNTNGSVVWANDNKTVFYDIKDEALRSFKVMKHVLGTPTSKDKEIYHEKDETFSSFTYKTKSEKYIIIGSYATLSQEYRYINADRPDDAFTVFQPREKKLEYSIDHFEDKWYIRTNKDEAKNFKIMSTPLG
jgi:oligopeptidase B